MIEIYQGRLGSGKTYSTVPRILSHLAKGLTVVLNVELNFQECFEYCKRHYGVEIQEGQLRYFDSDDLLNLYKNIPFGQKGAPILIVIDEASMWIGSKDWQKTHKNNPDFLPWLRQSRKVFQDIIFVAQSAKDVDAGVRRLCQFIWGFRDMDRFPLLGLPLFKGRIRWIQLDLDGKTVLNSGFKKKDTEIFKCYNTNALLKHFDHSEDTNISFQLKKVVEEKKQMRNPWILGGMLLAGMVGLLFLGWQLFGKSKKVDVVSLPVAPRVAEQRVVSKPAFQEERIRIVAESVVGGETSVIVIDEDGELRQLKAGSGYRGGEVLSVTMEGVVLNRSGNISLVRRDASPRVQLSEGEADNRASVASSLGKALGF